MESDRGVRRPSKPTDASSTLVLGVDEVHGRGRHVGDGRRDPHQRLELRIGGPVDELVLAQRGHAKRLSNRHARGLPADNGCSSNGPIGSATRPMNPWRR